MMLHRPFLRPLPAQLRTSARQAPFFSPTESSSSQTIRPRTRTALRTLRMLAVKPLICSALPITMTR
eukprot:1130744-Rhodomonas_salina.1